MKPVKFSSTVAHVCCSDNDALDGKDEGKDALAIGYSVEIESEMV